MIKKIKTSIELSLLVFIMFSLIVGVGVNGIIQIRLLNKTSEALVRDRMIPMNELGDVRHFTASILTVAQEANEKQITYQEALIKISKAQDSINKNWKAYLKKHFTSDEKRIVDVSITTINKSNATIEKLKSVLSREDAVALQKIVDKELIPALDSVSEMTTVLLTLQIDLAKKINKENVEVNSSYTQKFLWIMLIAFIVVIPFSYYLIKKNCIIIDSFNQNNAKLFLTEKNYRNLIEYAGEAILILNEETEIIDLNDYATQLFGYSREEMLLMKISALVAPEDVKKQTVDINEVRKNKFATIYRKVRRKDGTYIETEISNRLMEGKGFFAIIRDITERKKAQQAIKESEEKYRYLFNNNPAYIIIWDLESLAILEINEAILEKYGYTKEEWLSMTVLDYRPKEDFPKIKEFAKSMLQNDETVIKRNWRHYKKNGEEMLMDIASHKIIYNNRPAVLSLANDVTERVRAERKLFEREAQIQLFIEHSPAALAMVDNDMRYIATSKRWISDYNLTGQNIIGKTHYEVFPEIGQNWKDIHQRCLKGAVEKSDEDSFLRADGRIEWLHWEIQPWYEADGEIGGIIMFTEVITERKQATEMFKNLFENSPDIILYVNRHLKIEAINRVSSPFFSKEELIGAHCIDILPRESQEIARESVVKCFETKESQEIENALSSGKWVRSRIVPIINIGEVTHVVIFATDITLQRHAELSMLQSEEKYRTLTENISDGIVIMDENFLISYQSPSSERILGYTNEDVLSKSVINFIHPYDTTKAKEFYNNVLDSPNIPMYNQFRVINKEGTIVWMEGVSLNLLNNDTIRGVIINYRNITDRKMFEQHQSLMSSIIDFSDDAIISKSLEGIIISWNNGAEKILGYKSEDVIGKHTSIIIPLELREEEKEIINEVRQGKSVEHYETQRMKKNGELIFVSITISPIRDDSGNIIGASKIMRDISDRKNYENQLIRYNSELIKTNSELDQFVYSASHDLRAPLKSMIGLINLTAKDVKKKCNADAEFNTILERLAMLNKSATKLDNFIEDILNYSRNARMELESNEINFEELVNEVRTNLRFSDEKSIDFKVTINSKEVFFTDYNRLTVILNNIISNAYKYSDVDKENSFIHVDFTCDKNKATITVKDNGIGIANDDLSKVFDMFYRAASISTGSGLGLYIVKETVEKLKGKFDVQSELGIGSAFFIEIPNT